MDNPAAEKVNVHEPVFVNVHAHMLVRVHENNYRYLMAF
jgi:hypothetical protein